MTNKLFLVALGSALAVDLTAAAFEGSDVHAQLNEVHGRLLGAFSNIYMNTHLKVARQDERLDPLMQCLTNLPPELFPGRSLLSKRTLMAQYELTDEQLAALAEAIECAKDAIIEIASPCGLQYPGVMGPLHCMMDLIFDAEVVLQALMMPAGEYGALPDPFSAAAGLGIDPMIALIPQEMNSTTCTSVFGTSENPTYLGCMALLDFNDMDYFLSDMVVGWRNNDECTELLSLAGETPTTFAAGIDDETKTMVEQFDAETLKATFAGFDANFQSCSELDGGSLELALRGAYEVESGAAALALQVLGTFGIAISLALVSA